jgi:hypothetical protein
MKHPSLAALCFDSLNVDVHNAWSVNEKDVYFTQEGGRTCNSCLGCFVLDCEGGTRYKIQEVLGKTNLPTIPT